MKRYKHMYMMKPAIPLILSKTKKSCVAATATTTERLKEFKTLFMLFYTCVIVVVVAGAAVLCSAHMI